MNDRSENVAHAPLPAYPAGHAGMTELERIAKYAYDDHNGRYYGEHGGTIPWSDLPQPARNSWMAQTRAVLRAAIIVADDVKHAGGAVIFLATGSVDCDEGCDGLARRAHEAMLNKILDAP